MKFSINFVVLRMKDVDITYRMLLGRPWLKQAKVKQGWGENKIVFKKGKQSITVLMNGKKQMVVQEKPLFAQTINLADAVMKKKNS